MNNQIYGLLIGVGILLFFGFTMHTCVGHDQTMRKISMCAPSDAPKWCHEYMAGQK